MENETKKSKVGIYIIIAIIAALAIGIRIYNNYLEKEVQVRMERIMQKNIEDHGTPYFNY